MRTPLPIICQACQKTFYVYNSFYINKRPIRFCSRTCGATVIRKSKINDTYFGTITDENKHTFGQIIACGIIENNRNFIITSNELTLEKIQTKIGSNYKLNKAELGKLQLKITSSRMVENLLSHGLSFNPYYQEYPEYDILSGLLDTDCYKEVNGVKTFRHKSHKLILEMQYHLGGEIITETFKDVPRGGVMGCYWILVW
jgi:hypothetical protein